MKRQDGGVVVRVGPVEQGGNKAVGDGVGLWGALLVKQVDKSEHLFDAGPAVDAVGVVEAVDVDFTVFDIECDADAGAADVEACGLIKHVLEGGVGLQVIVLVDSGQGKVEARAGAIEGLEAAV